MRRLPSSAARGPGITLDLEGKAVPALEGEPVACALIAAGETGFSRSAEGGRPLGASCFAAICGHCRMRVDGFPDVFACRTPARAGMRLERQVAAPGSPRGALQTIEWILPPEHRGGAPLDAQAMAYLVGELAGLGLLPDRAPPPLLPAHELKTRVAVVGGGAAGLAAAEILGSHGVPFLLFEREAQLGGRLRVGAPEPGAPLILDPSTLRSTSLRRGAGVMGLNEDGAGRYLLVLTLEPSGVRVTKVYAACFLLAVGARPAMPTFPGSDLPGVYTGRAASLLAREHAVLPATAALVGWGPELYALAQLYAARGTQVRALVDLRGPLPAEAPAGACVGSEPEARGDLCVTELRFTPAGAERTGVECEALIVCVPPSPAVELARQGGAGIQEARGAEPARVLADEDGRTARADLFVAGDLTGAVDARSAARSGARAATALLRGLI